MLDAPCSGRRGGLPPGPEGWRLAGALLSDVEGVWERGDEGLGEVRG